VKNTAFAALALALLSSSALAAHPAKAPHFEITPLVSDQSGQAPNTDPNLVNPWGLSQSSGGPLWVSDEETGLSTVYDRNTGKPSTLVVTIPKGGPTGQVFSSGGFNVTEGSKTGASVFIFDSVTGVISGWAPSVDSANAIVAVDNSGKGAVYTGLTLANSQLYAANIAGNAVEVYDNTFAPVRTFTDPDLPKGFGPFNVAVIKNEVFVAFSHAEDDNHRAGRLPNMDKDKGKGFVDVFTLDGKLKKRLISGGHLNAPWGLAIAPKSYGSFKNALLVGNFGDGRINAYNAKTGDFLGTLQDTKGKDIQLDGLWALDNGPGDSITFSSGPEDETHGLIGLLSVAGK
jgi:uncharacterized protein (TIGR03118 family)